MDDKKSMG